jgi:hypothetical protein
MRSVLYRILILIPLCSYMPRCPRCDSESLIPRLTSHSSRSRTRDSQASSLLFKLWTRDHHFTSHELQCSVLCCYIILYLICDSNAATTHQHHSVNSALGGGRGLLQVQGHPEALRLHRQETQRLHREKIRGSKLPQVISLLISFQP